MNAAEDILGPSLANGCGHLPALICDDRSLSFSELDALSSRFGNALRARGVARGDRELFMLADTPELVALYLGAIKIGAVPAALSTRLGGRELGRIIADCTPKAIIVEPALRSRIAEIDHRSLPAFVALAGDSGGSPWPDIGALAAASPWTLDIADMAADDTAFMIYTSGTTGAPKAAVHRHGAVRIGDRHLRDNLGLRPGDRMFCTSKLSFAYALGHCLIGGLRAGIGVILHATWPDSLAIAAAVARHRPQVVLSVPTFYRTLLRDGAASSAGFSAVRHFVSAGEKLGISVGASWRDATGQPVLEGIGTSETLFLFIANTPAAWRPGATGRPLPWAEVRLADELGRSITAVDTPGLVWVRMDSLAVGYWQRPDQTAQAFRDGWYRSGDVFSIDRDGWWHHQGRADDMIRIAGQWVSPVEIEETVLATSRVADAAAIGIAAADGLTRLVLFLVGVDGAAAQELLEQQVRAALTDRLAPHKRPREIRFVAEIPRTATGKIQRFRLREMAGG